MELNNNNFGTSNDCWSYEPSGALGFTDDYDGYFTPRTTLSADPRKLFEDDEVPLFKANNEPSSIVVAATGPTQNQAMKTAPSQGAAPTTPQKIPSTTEACIRLRDAFRALTTPIKPAAPTTRPSTSGKTKPIPLHDRSMPPPPPPKKSRKDTSKSGGSSSSLEPSESKKKRRATEPSSKAPKPKGERNRRKAARAQFHRANRKQEVDAARKAEILARKRKVLPNYAPRVPSTLRQSWAAAAPSPSPQVDGKFY